MIRGGRASFGTPSRHRYGPAVGYARSPPGPRHVTEEPISRRPASDSTPPGFDISARLDDLFGELPADPPLRFRSLAELDSPDIAVRYIVPGVLPEAQVGAFIAAKKSFKTGVTADLGYSIATGTPFLGEYPVKRPGRVVFISGEVGEAGLKDWFSRIAVARGMTLRDAPGLEVCSDLPDLSRKSSIRYVAERCRDAALCVIDPMYMAFNVSGEDAKNVYAMGHRLGDLPRISQLTGCSILLLHHAKGANAEKYNVGPSLSDVAFTGVGELARFWLLTKHRHPYRHGKGWLYFRTGGQSGHEMETCVDIDEGVRVADDPDSRYWRTKVHLGGSVPEPASPRSTSKPAATRKTSADDETVLAYLRAKPAGVTENAIADHAFAPKRKRKSGVKKILERLRAAELAVPTAGQSQGREVVVWLAA